MPDTKNGQHFLVNERVADRIADHLTALNEESRYPLLEIGPGRGILTDRIREAGPVICCVEKDPRLARELMGRSSRDLLVINADILALSLSQLPLRPPVILVSNLPYYISSPMINWMIRHSQGIRGGILMVQREFYHRVLTGNQRQPRGLVFTHAFEHHRLFSVSPGSFSPPPKVKSTVFSFQNRERDPSDTLNYYHFLQRAFAHRRKKIMNNLTGHFPVAALREAFTGTGIDPGKRAENLSPLQLHTLYLALRSPR